VVIPEVNSRVVIPKLVLNIGVGKIFFKEGPIMDFFRGLKVVKFHFARSQLRKQPSLLKFKLKIVKF